MRARIRGANADADGALANYEQHVLLALEESENALSDYNKRQELLISLIKQSESSRKAADLASIQYRDGTADFLVLLDRQHERLAAEDSQALGEIDTNRGITKCWGVAGSHSLKAHRWLLDGTDLIVTVPETVATALATHRGLRSTRHLLSGH